MNCGHTQKHFDDYLDEVLSDSQRQSVETHVSTCPDCRSALRREQEFRSLLRQQPMAAPSEGFAIRALRHARTRNAAPKKGFASGFTAALAASLTLWVVTTLLQPSNPGRLPGITLALHQPQTVSLVINAPRDLTDATLALELPPGLEIVGFTGQRRLEWQTSLRHGQNLLALPLRAESMRSGEVVARVVSGEKEKRFTLPYEVSADTIRGRDPI